MSDDDPDVIELAQSIVSSSENLSITIESSSGADDLSVVSSQATTRRESVSSPSPNIFQLLSALRWLIPPSYDPSKIVWTNITDETDKNDVLSHSKDLRTEIDNITLPSSYDPSKIVGMNTTDEMNKNGALSYSKELRTEIDNITDDIFGDLNFTQEITQDQKFQDILMSLMDASETDNTERMDTA